MKKIKKGYIYSFVLGAILFSGITTVVATSLLATDVEYKANNSNFTATNVKDALDELYTLSNKSLVFVKKSDILFATGTTPTTQNISLDAGKYVFIASGRSIEYGPRFSITSSNANNTITKIGDSVSFSNFDASAYANGRGGGVLEIYEATIKEASTITFSISGTNSGYHAIGVLAIYK